MQLNPFNITKATDFSDDEINKFWVDLTDGQGFKEIMKPTSPMPILILGGKGSGKTHLMRYFSFPLQKIRNKNDNLLDFLNSEGYIGIYFKCSGLNANRFSEKNQSEDFWKGIFAYYIELWLAQLLLSILQEIRDYSKEIDEGQIVGDILSLFDEKVDLKNLSFQNLSDLLVRYQKKVDISINNYSIKRNLEDIYINISPGKLIFDVPRIISRSIRQLVKIQYLYLFDEFENLTQIQQKYINTLIRDRSIPCTFRLSGRLYGIKTLQTFSDNEENKVGSEFERVILDEDFRSSKFESKYEKFAVNLVVKRLSQYGRLPIRDFNNLKKSVDEFFESYNLENALNDINAKFRFRETPYLEKLRKKINPKENDIDQIIKNLEYSKDRLLERTNLFLFYRGWKNSTRNLLEISNEVKENLLNFLTGNKDKSDHQKVLEKFKSDIQDQLLLECGEKKYYAGIETFIKMSAGIPRILLMILKQIYKWSSFNGENPFSEGKISLDAQLKGVKEASAWFFEDAKIQGENGIQVHGSIIRLATLLREIRYSDIPPECSLSSISINESELKESTLYYLNLANQHSFIVDKGSRIDRNSKRIDRTYQLNGILAPLWDLPINKRGDLFLNASEVDAIFNPEFEINFDQITKERLKRYNAPFTIKDSGNDQFNLF